MRFSTLINQTIKAASKGKNTEECTTQIVDIIKGAVKAYKGTSKGALKANKKLKADTVRGCVNLSILDEESLLMIIKQRHSQAVLATCDNGDDDDNYSLNAELCRAIATDNILLGAVYWMSNPDTASTKLL